MITNSGWRTLLLAAMIVTGGIEAAQSCGSSTVWIKRYGEAPNDGVREAALNEISAFCSDYLAADTGPKIAGLVLDATTAASTGGCSLAYSSSIAVFPM